MVAAAAPSSALVCRGLPCASRRAAPERWPRGGDGVVPGQRGLCGRWEAGGGREGEGGRRGRASAPAAPGPAGPIVCTA